MMGTSGATFRAGMIASSAASLLVRSPPACGRLELSDVCVDWLVLGFGPGGDGGDGCVGGATFESLTSALVLVGDAMVC